MFNVNFKEIGIIGDVKTVTVGELAKNQYIVNVWTEKNVYNIFYSYKSLIICLRNGRIERIGKNWNYSKTTSKYRNIFCCWDKKTIEKFISEKMTYCTNIEQYVLRGDN